MKKTIEKDAKIKALAELSNKISKEEIIKFIEDEKIKKPYPNIYNYFKFILRNG